jgi:hypothetical protein
VLEVKQKNNYLAVANVRETEHMAKRARVSIEPSEQRYEMHLQDIQTPQKVVLENNPNPPKCESEVNSKQPDTSPVDTEKKDAVEESHGGPPPPESSSKRKRFLSLGFLSLGFL